MNADLESRAVAGARELQGRMVAWRRDLHQRPELGFCEFQTASYVLDALEGLPVRIFRGAEAQDISRVHSRDASRVAAFAERAVEAGIDPQRVESFRAEGTGLVVEVGAGNGPIVGIRVDMDALPIEEADGDHLPAREGFRSRHEGLMHACGHDGHTAIGLGVVTALSKFADELPGRVRVFFQPAEEGTMGGGASMVARPLVGDLDAVIPIHIGLGVAAGTVASAVRYMATTKFRVRFKGRGAHVVAEPQAGANALLAAAAAALQLQALPPHSDGWYSLNVGTLRAGDEQGIIPPWAVMELGIWAERQSINDFLVDRVRAVVEACAAAQDCSVEIEIFGKAPSAIPDAQLADVIDGVAGELELASQPPMLCKAGEDATEFVNAVQAHGGAGTMIIIGSELAAGHHQPRFDFDERTLGDGAALLAKTAVRLISQSP
jgi:aminobenzoyl-glutamate utilization protein A